MNLANFDTAQRQTLLDLAVLAMYSDGHLAAAEDDRVQRLLATLSDASEHERQLQYDASIGRVSRYTTTVDVARNYAVALARRFTDPGQRKQVEEIIRDLLASDTIVSPKEAELLTAIRAALQG